MTHSKRWILPVMSAVLMGALALPAQAQDKVKVLFIDGQNATAHKWQETDPAIKDMLEKTGRFTVDILTTPPALPKNATPEQKKAGEEAWAKFKPEFSKYQVVLSNYSGTPWPDDVKKAFEKFVADGGGFVAYHFAVAAFPEWDAYNKMIGLGWKNNKFGEGLCFDDSGKLIRRPKGEGPNNGHGAAHSFEVAVRDEKHPITEGFPAKWKHVKDELYAGQHGPAQDMTILATAYSAKEPAEIKGTGFHEPMAWTIPFGKGRCFVSLLGHDVAATIEPLAGVLLARGVEWAATGKVTIPVPKDAAPAEKK